MPTLAPFTLALAAAVASSAFFSTTSADELCSSPPSSYLTAKVNSPQLASALVELEKLSIATWYTDSDSQYGSTAYKLIECCKKKASRLNAVIYGLPGKDCMVNGGGVAASVSTVKTSADYEAFLADFIRIIGSRKIAYVLEPGAVSLLVAQDPSSGCAHQAEYLESLQTATRLLSANANAEIYVDVGHWTLGSAESSARVVEIVKKLAGAGRLKGIALNTANYRSTTELSQLCTTFQEAMGSFEYHCVIDTSRNFVGSTAATANSTISTISADEWCNLRPAGIGQPPTCTTGISNIDYFLWLKPPGESDGVCPINENSIQGAPPAGVFFDQGLVSLWNQGYFVNRLRSPRLISVPTPVVPTAVNVCPTPAWGTCGDISDTKCCPSGFYCQPWNSGFYQCMQVPAKCSQQFTDTNFVGADLYKLTGSSPTDCCLKCAATSGCRRYTFVNQDGASCYLKSQVVGNQKSVLGAVSGIMGLA